MLIKTANSTYELDQTNKRIRRIEGNNMPTTAFGADGVWQPYTQILELEVGKRPFISWTSGTVYTILSEVQEITNENAETECQRSQSKTSLEGRSLQAAL